MTAHIVRIKPDWLRKFVWLMWFPPGVYLDLWLKFRNNKSFDSLVWAAWDLGWHGIQD